MTRLGELVFWLALIIDPNHDIRVTDLDGERYHIQSFERQEWAFGNIYRGFTIYRGEPEFEWITVQYEADPFRPHKGWTREVFMFDSNGKRFRELE